MADHRSASQPAIFMPSSTERATTSLRRSQAAETNSALNLRMGPAGYFEEKRERKITSINTKIPHAAILSRKSR